MRPLAAATLALVTGLLILNPSPANTGFSTAGIESRPLPAYAP